MDLKVKAESEDTVASTNTSKVLHIERLNDTVSETQIRRAITCRGLKRPVNIRLARTTSSVSALVEFASSTAADLVLQSFQRKLFSESENITFHDVGIKKGQL